MVDYELLKALKRVDSVNMNVWLIINPFACCSMFSGQHPQHGPGACKPLQWTEPQTSEKNEGLLSGSSASFKRSESICVQSRS
ncbi:hypothetical protein E5288_WYG019798 [Bos mutus]|uniref:Uncharacterized protein n=1 Tax=Bos mutus TaxID=72004 RepID=A0A6B0RQJ2_9CETA|nr:hypothetical protein [Bos mutus]